MTAPSALGPWLSRPPLRTGPVVEAARSALRPPGPVRWTSTSAPTGSSCARLSVAVQGRQTLVSHPDQPGVLAVLHAGDVVPPRREELLLHAMLLHEPDPTRHPAPDLTAVLRWLRRAAESEGAWLRLLPEPLALSAALGPCWDGPDRPPLPPAAHEPVAVVIGAPGRPPAADLRAGQAVETVRLTATALGLDLHVLATPATTTTAIERRIGRTTDTLAIVQIGRPGRAEDGNCDLSDRRAT